MPIVMDPVPAAPEVKLRAVNDILAAVHEYPIDVLDTGGTSVAALAEAALDSQTGRVLTDEGWHFNTEIVTLTPDDDGYVILADDVLVADTTGTSAYVNVAMRGGKLYDLDENTDVFTGTLDVVEVLSFDFGDIPGPIREYITAVASQWFQRRQIGGETADRFLSDEVTRARLRARKFDAETADTNILAGSFARHVTGRTYSGESFR